MDLASNLHSLLVNCLHERLDGRSPFRASVFSSVECRDPLDFICLLGYLQTPLF